MNKVLRDQLRLFDSMWAALRKEEDELSEHFNIARNLACTEWSDSIIPSFSGGYDGKVPNKMLPDKMGLLRSNHEMLLNDIYERRAALVILFKPVFKAAERHMPVEDYGEARA